MHHDQTFLESVVLGITPFEQPDTALVVALHRAGALGILDVGRDPARAREALAALARTLPRGFGVRIPEYVDLPNLPAAARVVVLPARVAFSAPTFGERTVLVQVTSIAEARAAIAFGAHGLIVKGNEAGGRVGDETSLVLLQRVIAEAHANGRGAAVPVWVQGGVGLHGAAACIAGGARGVVLDAQLSLLEESSTPAETRRAIAAMDGSETVVVADHRIFSRPNVLAPAPGASPRDVATHFGATDLSRELLAAGQDAAFAKGFADRFRTAGGLVRALRASIASHIHQARVRPPLAAGSRLAADHGIRFPIAQGPMTRVSDRAPFARAVADAGALPFLALSLMRGAEASLLLEQTAEMLGARPWGVGVLGFLPQDVRDEQLALLQKVRPPVVIIAGGRPSQARPLEAAGIVTYLHVPSPGLLDLFLKDGARRFVFEGRECGGHVGPRSSFVLWEMAIERLLAMEDVRDVSVLFAGGIHDGRSAAMVSAMAAPLAARGARIGVLMGTAYLFTEEAVSAGAITRTFQEEAIRCGDTVLVETAPGHATRCADGDFVRAFQAERDRLANDGVSAQDSWAALEQLNLGRLRIAAKGLRREGDAIVHVDDDVQRREGMFMIGQVASLRGARLGVEALHADVIDGSTAILRDLVVPTAASGREPPPVDVAIVGMACIFPDAPDLAAFWKNITLGTNAIREVPAERWSTELYYDPAGTGDKTPSKWGGFLPDVAFDPGKYGIPPRSLAAIDPAQLLSLEVAHRALVDAGYADRDFDRERTSVVFGAESGTDLTSAYGFRASYPQFLGAIPRELDAHLPTLTEDSFPGVLSNVIAGRIANRLDLGGVNYTVDAACASSLAALDVACKELASGTSDMVISGGADLHNSINDYLLFASVHALSPTGQCRTFDASADGIALGEGVAAVVLKRLADAERDGDRVYAVIKGIGGSSDGKSLGLTAPRREGQSRALERAYARAGVSPVDVGLVEAHGTGTVVGDRTELAALGDFFGGSGAAPAGCTLGSVKSQIGHTKCAAGLAGLIKASLAIHRGVLPPTRNIAKPNPAYDGASSPFVFRDTASPWADTERRAGVSAFGFGGTNFHVVLEAHRGEPAAAAGLDEWPAELFLFRGADRASALAAVRAFEARLDDDAPHRLRDLARTLAVVAEPGPVQLAIVADSVADLKKKLHGAHASAAGATDANVFVARESHAFGDDAVALVFPGQGSQRPGMMADLFVAFPELHDLLRLGARWTDRLFPPAAFTPEERTAQQRAITDTRVAQPALGMVGLAMARLLARSGVKPAMTAGHSYGELVALTVAGSIPARALLDLSALRAECILDAATGNGGAPGTMAAVRAPIATVEAALEGLAGVVLANHNAPDQVVIAGTDDAVRDACERLAARSITARAIPVACAFHSPIVAAASETFAAHLEAVTVSAPRVPVFANTTAGPYPSDAAGIRFQLARQLALPVRFADQIEAMYAAGARVFVESGPGGVLSDLVSRTLGARPHVAIPCDGGAGGNGLRALLVALGRLAVAGVSVDALSLFEGRDAHVVPLETARVLAPTTWIVNGHTARPLHGELPPFAMKPITAPLAIAHVAAGHSSVVVDREATVLEYMQGMREMVEAQRQVMLRYLGTDAAESDAADRAEGALTLRPPRRAAATAHAPTNGKNGHAIASTNGHAATTMLPPAPMAPLEALIATVSERTGYPADMLDPDLDLEADLGIDSIKRIEILGTMSEKLALKLVQKDGPSEAVEELAGVKTLRGIATWLEKRLGLAPGGSTAGAPDAAPVSEPPPSSQSDVTRYVLSVGPLPHAVPNGVTVKGQSFVIVRDAGGVASALATRLEARGASVRIISPGEPLGALDGLVFLESLAADSPGSLKTLFTMAKEAALGDAKWIVAATGLGGSFGRGDAAPTAMHGGVAGLLKSVAKEWPDLRVRSIDLHPGEDPGQLADHVYAELLASDVRVEVGYAGGVRQTLSVLPGPPSGPPDASSLDIGRDAVVLVTGGARGITARVAIAMAQRFQCHLELVGRSPAPEDDEDPELAGADDAIALRKVLLARANGAGPTTPAAIDALCNQVLSAREIRATFAAIRAAGSDFRYHAIDVRDGAAFGALLDDVYARHGRLDGVVHGAGLVEDKLLRDKTPESFDRVYDTKVSSALTLSEKLRGDARFVVFFSSVSGAFGNRGQVDYAAANAALDTLAHHMDRKIAARVLSINWGPWGGVGMVRPELEREYARRGVGLIAPDDGVARFFDELCLHKDSQVILSATAPGLLQ
jgi:acyl transferase domain-containing protein/NAD(P)H-dependent flavin oxidoreductase YrpB (nitropropane dioxygenase family)